MVVEAASHFPEHDSDAAAFSAPHTSLQPALPHPSRGPGAPRPPQTPPGGRRAEELENLRQDPHPRPRGGEGLRVPPNLG